MEVFNGRGERRWCTDQVNILPNLGPPGLWLGPLRETRCTVGGQDGRHRVVGPGRAGRYSP